MRLHLWRPFVFSLAATLPLVAADWPQFLGPERNAVAAAAEPTLPESFSADLKPVWQKPVGSGFAGPVVDGSTVVVFHREGSDMVTEALAAESGKPKWRTTYVTDYVDSFGFDNGPRAAPSIANGKVFTHGPEGRVTALDFETGKELWAYDTASQVGSEQGFFGRAASPLVVGDRIIIAAGGSKNGRPAGLIALAMATGKMVWHGVDDEAGYASPVRIAGSPKDPSTGQVLAWMRNKLWLVDVDTGNEIDAIPLRSTMDASVNAATPVPCGEDAKRWFVSAGYGVGAQLFNLTPAKAPAFEPIWQKQDLMDCHYSTPVFLSGHLYGFHGRQETGQTLRCIDLKTAKTKWESPEAPGGTVLAVGEKLLVVTEQGELWVVRATPEKFDQIASIQILRAGHRSHAAFANGVLFARDSENLIAIKLH